MGGETAPGLVAALEDAQRLGFLGQRPIPEVIEHARGFVRALQQLESLQTVLDLGSGAGIPGLIIAHDLAAVHVTLVDRRAKRTDVLERVIRRLGWQHRVMVVCRDVTAFVPDRTIDAVVARGFGPPTFTLSQAARLVRPGGSIVISEPPGDNRWDQRLLAELRLDQVAATASDTASALSPDGLDGLVATFVRRVDHSDPRA